MAVKRHLISADPPLAVEPSEALKYHVVSDSDLGKPHLPVPNTGIVLQKPLSNRMA